MRRISARCRFPLAAAFAVLVAVSLTTGVRADSFDERQHSVQEQLGAVRGRIEGARESERVLTAEIAERNDEIGHVRARVGELGAELERLERNVSDARVRLEKIEDRLREQAGRIALLRRQLRIAERRLEDRVVEVYTAGDIDFLSIVVGAESLGDALEQVDLYSNVLEQDSRIIEEVEDLRAKTVRARRRTELLRRRQADETSRLAERAAERRAALSALVAERDRLSALRIERTRALASVRLDRRQWEAEADALRAESERISSLITAAETAPPPTPTSQPSGGGAVAVDPAAAAAASPSPSPSASDSSGLAWPLSGTVVSPYGTRWGRLHAGIDIAAPAGMAVGAAAAGTVVYAGWMDGYGLLVVLQHANGIATAYAHNSSLSVSQGVTVASGQTVATVGCTGRCFGDHVHFEVRVGGNPVDPLGYL